MVRGFAGGNLIVGSLMAAVTIGVLLAIRMDGAAALGMASGLLNLIPFLGVVLASVVPLLAATLQFSTAGPFLIIALTVVSLHLLSANLLIPKFIGSRVDIGPVAATVGMLFWSWLWGAIGLLLAVPLTAFVKLVADCHPALLPTSSAALGASRPRNSGASDPVSARSFSGAARVVTKTLLFYALYSIFFPRSELHARRTTITQLLQRSTNASCYVGIRSSYLLLKTNDPITITHHQNPDQAGGPHAPNDGGLWAHMGWILTGKAMHQNTAELLADVPDLRKQKFYMLISKYHWAPRAGLGAILYAIGGWSCVMWGVFLRTVVGLHATWLVNSATHMWGSRRFLTGDTSTNSFWVAILTFGEGWHNNHHAAPQAAKHGLTWYEIDVNWYGIWALEKLGLAWDIKLPKLPPMTEPSIPLESPAIAPNPLVEEEAFVTSSAGD